MPKNRAQELTYYDELGVARNATPDEIRDSFRVLVRLVHPDHHTDQNLKVVAETQMRKLNRIYNVLSDPTRRREYDNYLQEDHGPSTPLMSDRLRFFFGGSDPGKANQLIGRLTWISAVAIVVGLLVWLASDVPATFPVVAADKAAVAKTGDEAVSAPRDAAAELAQARVDLKIARFERDAAVRELTKMRGAGSAAFPSSIEERGRVEAPVSPANATLTELPTNNRPATRSFGGFWFYMRAPDDKTKNAGLYPPEFAEANIVEQNGQVRGRYRSRYRILDRAISPDVNFEFSGTVSGATVTAAWVGPGGARGEITMKMLSDNSIRIDWTADQLGSVQGLASGTASLTRRID